MPHVCPSCGSATLPEELGSWDLRPNSASRNGRPLRLTAAEAAVLFALKNAQAQVMSPIAIGRQFSASQNNANSVRVIIARLRRKLGADCPIETVHGFGYRWCDPADGAASASYKSRAANRPRTVPSSQFGLSLRNIGQS